MRQEAIEIMSQRGIEKMRAAGQLAAELLDHLSQMLAPGVSTGEINDEAERWTQERGAVSAPLGYPDGLDNPGSFQKSICTSVNEVICHGIPDHKHILKDGDIINIDVTPKLDGYHGDTSKTFIIGKASPEIEKLVQVTEECLRRGISQVQPGAPISAIGKAIQSYAEAQGFSVVRDFVGHGIGRVFHCPPQVFHYETDARTKMKTGMVFTIEPMINMGTWKAKVLKDGWTAITQDKKLSAQFEHTLVVTDKGCEVLTLKKGEIY